MAGHSYSDLPKPKKPHRLDRDTRHEDGIVRLRERETELRRDIRRDKLLKDTSKLTIWEAERARDLQGRLQRANETGVPAQTFASAVYHREARMPILSSLWKKVEEHADQPQGLVTLRPQGMLYRADDLFTVKPADLVKRLRNDFNRKGITAAPGFGFFGLDADFDANRYGGVFDFHFHGIIVGEKLHAIENLRDMRKYDKARLNPLEHGLKPSNRWQVQEPLFNLPDPITYCLESWVPHRPTRIVEDGSRKRSTTKREIPSPYKQRWLIWMDQQRIEDFILLSNLRPTKAGFQLIHP
jgi:hypothetical protein